MKKKTEATPVSVRDVAEAAGLSKSAASYALRNHPSIGKATRDRVWKVAKKLGYSRDARLNSWMSQIRGSKSKELLPIAWLNSTTNPTFRSVKYLAPYFEGAETRCQELGYKLEEIWLNEPGLTHPRVSRILHHRGIEAAILGLPPAHMRLDFDHLAAVCLEGSLMVPQLHRVTANLTFNLTLAMRSVRRMGYRRVGVCLTEEVDRFSHHLIRCLLHFQSSTIREEDRIAPLFHHRTVEDEAKARQTIAWVEKEKPEVMICHDNRMLGWMESTGRRVPEDLGIVHLALDDDVLGWSGIYSNRRMIGRTAAELVISLLQNRQIGVPQVAGEMLINGYWENGRTLLSRKEMRAANAA